MCAHEKMKVVNYKYFIPNLKQCVIIYNLKNLSSFNSLDARKKKPITSALHWVSKELDRRNVKFQIAPREGERPGLVIEKTSVSDRGEYICRVDFTDSPTRNNRVQLHVIGEYLFI